MTAIDPARAAELASALEQAFSKAIRDEVPAELILHVAGCAVGYLVASNPASVPEVAARAIEFVRATAVEASGILFAERDWKVAASIN